MSTFASIASIKNQLQKLVDIANDTTGQTDSNLTSAIGTLVEGYGIGSGGVRIPACIASVGSDINNIIDHVVYIGAVMSVEGGEYVQTHALYGNARLPLLPEDVLAQYPYAFIYKNRDETFYRLVLSTGIWWYSYTAERNLYPVVTENRPVYKADLNSDKWEFLEYHTDKKIYLAYFNSWYADLNWSNFNVPDGSADATSFYKTATEPGLTL